MDGWDIVLLVVAGFVAIAALVRLMLRRREQLVERFRRDLKQQQRHQQNAEPPRERPAKRA